MQSSSVLSYFAHPPSRSRPDPEAAVLGTASAPRWASETPHGLGTEPARLPFLFRLQPHAPLPYLVRFVKTSHGKERKKEKAKGRSSGGRRATHPRFPSRCSAPTFPSLTAPPFRRPAAQPRPSCYRWEGPQACRAPQRDSAEPPAAGLHPPQGLAAAGPVVYEDSIGAVAAPREAYRLPDPCSGLETAVHRGERAVCGCPERPRSLRCRAEP